MENKFMNLKKEYKDFIEKISMKIKEINIDNDLDKNECIKIYKLYLEINNIIEENNQININDINHIILNYNKENEDIKLFKKFIKIKNLYIIKRIIQSNLWNNLVDKTISKLNIKIDESNKKNKYIIEKGIYNLLIKSSDLFKGCWEIANIKDGKIINLEIFEPEDIDFLINYYKKKLIK